VLKKDPDAVVLTGHENHHRGKLSWPRDGHRQRRLRGRQAGVA
jgi:hypothetical protein